MRRALGGMAALAFILMLSAGCTSACSAPAAQRVVIMSYNVENLFDATDAGSEYAEYSVAAGRWDAARYKTRLGRLAEVVRAAAPTTKGPDVVCLMEVETRGVLEELRTGPLAGSGYKAAALVPAPHQAVNCGVLSRLPLRGLRALGLAAGVREGRHILEVGLDVGGRELTVFVCHWKSKLEGAEATEAERREASALVAGRVAELLGQNPAAELFVCGDFNENPDEYALVEGAYRTALMPASASPDGSAGSIAPLPQAERDAAERKTIFVADAVKDAGPGSSAGPILYSPWAEWGGYSYFFKGRGERIDGYLLAPGLLDGEGLTFAAFRSLPEAFLLDAQGLPVSYNAATGAGYSDHLPIVLELELRLDAR